MKVLFVYPNINAQVGFNYGLAFISSLLRSRGHETRLINLNEKLGSVPSPEEVAKEAERFGARLVGFSCVTPQYQIALDYARRLKSDLPAVKLVCGGIHPTMTPDEVLSDGVFDFVCVGEGEEATLELVEALDKGLSTDNVRNMWFRRDEQVVRTGVRPFVDLATLPAKDYDVFDFQRMIDRMNGWVGIMSSRGCPFGCTYCFNHKMREFYRKYCDKPGEYIRRHPAAKVVAEMEMLRECYKNVRMFIFDDDLFTMDKDYVREFSELYSQRVGLPFVANAHVRFFDEEVAVLLARAGCRIIKFGLESGSERVRREIMNRKMTNDEIFRAFEAARLAGLHSSAFVMMGLPTETPEELRDTIRLLGRIRPGRFRWAVFYPFVGTRAWQIALERGCVNQEKMRRLTNFTDESCLDFGSEQNLLIRKMKAAYPWYVNAASDLPCAEYYGKLLRVIERMGPEEWARYEPGLRKLDEHASQFLQELGQEHYAIRFNDFMAVQSTWQDP